MTAVLKRLFFEHPESVDETYGQHARFATGFALQLFVAAFAALIHALIPGLFAKTASNIVHRLADRTRNRGR
jgi:hypothetical protein